MRPRGKSVAWAVAGAVAVGILSANAHLAYVAFASQPACVPHLRTGEVASSTAFTAANSSC